MGRGPGIDILIGDGMYVTDAQWAGLALVALDNLRRRDSLELGEGNDRLVGVGPVQRRALSHLPARRPTQPIKPRRSVCAVLASRGASSATLAKHSRIHSIHAPFHNG